MSCVLLSSELLFPFFSSLVFVCVYNLCIPFTFFSSPSLTRASQSLPKLQKGTSNENRAFLYTVLDDLTVLNNLFVDFDNGVVHIIKREHDQESMRS